MNPVSRFFFSLPFLSWYSTFTHLGRTTSAVKPGRERQPSTSLAEPPNSVIFGLQRMAYAGQVGRANDAALLAGDCVGRACSPLRSTASGLRLD